MKRIRTSITDNKPDFLINKIVAGTGTTINEITINGSKKLEIAALSVGGGSGLKTVYFPLIFQAGGAGSFTVSNNYNVVGLSLDNALLAFIPSDFLSLDKVELTLISANISSRDFSINTYKTSLNNPLNQTLVGTVTPTSSTWDTNEVRMIDLTSLFTGINANSLFAIQFVDNLGNLASLNALNLRMTYT